MKEIPVSQAPEMLPFRPDCHLKDDLVMQSECSIVREYYASHVRSLAPSDLEDHA